MSKQIERILICVLWLLAALLGACFWLNTAFGFNIFSAAHWQYLAYLQATQTPVRPAFYISLTCAIIITFAVLYILIRPQGMLRRRIGFARARARQNQNTQSAPPPTPTVTQPAARMTPPPVRPRAPNSPHVATPTPPAPQFTPVVTQPAAHAQPAASSDFDALHEIFEKCGYVVKRNPQIGNFKPALFAIGTGEALWLGAVGMDQAPLAAAMERLGNVFNDTLDDIQINIYGFIVAPSAPVTSPDIQSFPNVAALREYMESNKNTPPDDADGTENFNAYSEYIDTVINYMDKT